MSGSVKGQTTVWVRIRTRVEKWHEVRVKRGYEDINFLELTETLEKVNKFSEGMLLLLLSRFSRVDSVRPHRRQPTRLPRPWDSPGKNTGVGCHFLLQRMKVKSEGEVSQWFSTLSDPMDCSLPGSSVHGIFQARVLEWVAIAFSSEGIGKKNLSQANPSFEGEGRPQYTRSHSKWQKQKSRNLCEHIPLE